MRISLCLALLLISLSSGGQTARDQFEANPELAKGIYYINDYSAVPKTRAPRGYKAVCISHYARHGARFQGDDEAYRNALEPLAKAYEANALNDYGKNVYRKMSSYYESCRGRHGDLTPLGWEQQQSLARQMYTLYPEIFKKNPTITATSSLVTRCIMSMSAFGMGLKSMDPGLEIYEEASRSKLDGTNPGDRQNVNYVKTEVEDNPWGLTYSDYQKRRIPDEEGERIVSRLFDDKEFMKAEINCRSLASALYNFIIGMGCLDTDIRIDDLFTDGEMLDYYDVLNFGFYEWGAQKKNSFKPIVVDMVMKAQEDLASGKPTVRLRFGHDTNLLGVLCLLGVDDFAFIPERPEELWLTYCSWRVPMAATFELILYKKKNCDRVLFKGILNGDEVRFSALNPVSGPYYDFNDLVEFVSRLASPEERFRAMAAIDTECSFSIFNDMHCNTELYSRLASSVPANDDFIVLNGDIVSGGEYTLEETSDLIMDPLGNLPDRVPVFFCRGNHETRGSNAKYIGRIFHMPENEKFYYSFKYGPAAFIVLDAGETNSKNSIKACGEYFYREYLEEELAWLKKTVKERSFTEAGYKICLIHVPMNGSLESAGSNVRGWMRKYMMPVLNSAGLTLMICGDLHEFGFMEKGSAGNSFPVFINDDEERLHVVITRESIAVQAYDASGNPVEGHRYFQQSKGGIPMPS
ncbi:MAG: metallophosphoesterase [Candidatus Cryptobacteroides sp.]